MGNRVQVKFEGHVQGVGFRYTTRIIADGFQISGYVKNLPDGSVEVVAEGEKQELELFLNEILASRLSSCISNHRVVWQDSKSEFEGFDIAY